MDCAEIRRGFLTGTPATGELLDAHLAECAHCSELFGRASLLGRRLASAASEPPRDIAAQMAKAEAAVAGERGLRAYLRSRSTRTRWALSLTFPALLLLREVARKRVPWRVLSAPRLLLGLVLLGMLALVAHGALSPLPIERRAARLRSVLAAVTWSLPCLLWLAPETQASSAELTGSFALRSLSCFVYGSALAAPSFVLLWAFDRGAYVPFRVWALAAGMVALVANLILLLHCPLTHRAHLLLGHLSIGFAWLLAVSASEWWRRRA